MIAGTLSSDPKRALSAGPVESVGFQIDLSVVAARLPIKSPSSSIRYIHGYYKQVTADPSEPHAESAGFDVLHVDGGLVGLDLPDWSQPALPRDVGSTVGAVFLPGSSRQRCRTGDHQVPTGCHGNRRQGISPNTSSLCAGWRRRKRLTGLASGHRVTCPRQAWQGRSRQDPRQSTGTSRLHRRLSGARTRLLRGLRSNPRFEQQVRRRHVTPGLSPAGEAAVHREAR